MGITKNSSKNTVSTIFLVMSLSAPTGAVAEELEGASAVNTSREQSTLIGDNLVVEGVLQIRVVSRNLY